MGLLCGILNDSLPRNQHRGDNDVDGRPHGNHIQVDSSTTKAAFPSVCIHIGIRFLNLGAQRQKAFHMLVNGARRKIASAGQRHPGMAKSAKLRSNEIIRSPNAPNQGRVGLCITHMGAINLHRVMGFLGNGSTHLL